MDWVRRKIWTCMAPLCGLLLLGCGEGGSRPDLTFEGAWVRPAHVEMGEDGTRFPANSAAYLVIRNRGSGADQLLGGETSAADAVELHESFLEGEVMRMRAVGSLEVPGEGAIELRPGGLHFMLLDLRRSLALGDTISLTLQFLQSGSLEVEVPVQTTGET